jgi:hypothetical protein
MPRTAVEILDSNLNKIAEVKALVPLDKAGTDLRYSRLLSNFGTCSFRIDVHDPLLARYGDITVPHAYHVRLMREGVNVWQGAIVDNPQRNKYFIEVKAATYLFYLAHVFVNRTSMVGYGEVAPTTNIGYHYRIFSSGTMASAVSTIITETQAKLGGAHLMKNLAPGTITNPNYPVGFTNSLGAELTGPWNFSADVVMQFDYQSVLYVLRSFGVNARCDFRLNADSTLDFEPFLGNKHPGIVFTYGQRGNVVNYNAPRLGSAIINDYYGIGTDPNGTILHKELTDEPSKAKYGLMEGAIAFTDVKDQNALVARLSADLFLVKDPDADSPLALILDEKGYSLGQYDVGDLVSVKIVDGAINYSAIKRVVGITVNQNSTGRELTTVQTNNPQQVDLVGL